MLGSKLTQTPYWCPQNYIKFLSLHTQGTLHNFTAMWLPTMHCQISGHCLRLHTYYSQPHSSTSNRQNPYRVSYLTMMYLPQSSSPNVHNLFYNLTKVLTNYICNTLRIKASQTVVHTYSLEHYDLFNTGATVFLYLIRRLRTLSVIWFTLYSCNIRWPSAEAPRHLTTSFLQTKPRCFFCCGNTCDVINLEHAFCSVMTSSGLKTGWKRPLLATAKQSQQ